jgi:hypothetical protein
MNCKSCERRKRKLEELVKRATFLGAKWKNFRLIVVTEKRHKPNYNRGGIKN